MKKSKEFSPRICEVCGLLYTPRSGIQKYCVSCKRDVERKRRREWYRKKYNGKPRIKSSELCCVCGAEFSSHFDGKPYCNKHYLRIKTNGTVDRVIRSSTNLFCNSNGMLYITTANGQKIKADLEDEERLRKYSWCISKTGYAVANIGGKTTKMHRYIMGLTDPKQVIDHKNHDKLDNRKTNLRVCTHSDNSKNQRGNYGRNLPVGIRINSAGRYAVRIMADGVEHYIGTYGNLNDAIHEREKAEVELFGEYAQCLNR